jgi:glycine betaine/proline transport system substrate-binding protein
MAEEYPDITDWQNLDTYAELFRTSESGDKGQFLGGDPSYVSNDAALIDNLELDFQLVNSGSEAALIESFRQATIQRTPLLGTSTTHSGPGPRSRSCPSRSCA